MISSGFTNAPISKYVMVFIIASSITASIADVKYLLYIQVVPHLWQYWQVWRLGVWQLAYTNSGEALFAALLVYQLRVIERLWGSRKFGSFLITTLPYTTLLPPLLLSLLLRPLSLNTLNYLPAGPTAILFALLVQFYSAIPHAYKYRIATTTSSSSSPISQSPSTSTSSPTPPSLKVSDKSTTYLLAAQLALAQFPHSLIPAAIGWAVGYAWRSEVLPGRATAWRVPGWVYGDMAADAAAGARGHGRGVEGGAAGSDAGAGAGAGGDGMHGVSSGRVGGWRSWAGLRRVTGGTGGDGERFEGLRRRLEGESRAAAAAAAAAAAGGVRGGVGDRGGVNAVGDGGGGEGGEAGQGQGQQRRPLAGQILDQFTGSF
ncbi:hypothetical protein BDDG_05586 [Blastomyces dermatitidis ATCC 18188]|uniref:UBA domain-containing protein Ucp14 n=1 Tax=Ajellomyces dermatitidis (strain ATCC 18188 / CBS 674.68) TaxID=653446 RepID=F2THC9_AJEDA|nr:hypothetical protein BDDG_05586 [Blastomyces dermatitidis ATCC 18188]